MESRRFPKGRAVILTFDDGYLDFREYAWPILHRYGFSAMVFIVTELAGSTNLWEHSERDLPLLGWEDIRFLHGQGIEFGSHSSRHSLLTSLTAEELVTDFITSRMTLMHELGAPVDTVAYPHGGVNGAVRHLAGACGFTFGLSDRSGLARVGDSYLELPRVEISGEDTFETFVTKVTFGSNWIPQGN